MWPQRDTCPQNEVGVIVMPDNMSASWWMKVDLKGRLALMSWKWRSFMEIRKVFRNWQQVALFRFGLKKRVQVEWCSGELAAVKSSEDWARLKLSYLWCVELLKAHGRQVSVTDGEIRFMFHNKLLRFKMDPTLEAYSVLSEQFLYEDYQWLRVKGKCVLDIGGSIGDSAIYFAACGAAHVYVLEPYPYSCQIAEANIRLNALERNVTLLNMGCGKEGTMTVKADFKADPGSALMPFEEGKQIFITSLKQLIARYELSDAIAKIDCEGCEYELILGATDGELRAFSRMIIEYHREFISLMNRMEKAGFHVVRTPHFHSRDQHTGESIEVGFLKAERLPN